MHYTWYLGASAEEISKQNPKWVAAGFAPVTAQCHQTLRSAYRGDRFLRRCRFQTGSSWRPGRPRYGSALSAMNVAGRLSSGDPSYNDDAEPAQLLGSGNSMESD